MGFQFDREKFEKYLQKNLEADSEEKVIDCNTTILSTVSSRTLQSHA